MTTTDTRTPSWRAVGVFVQDDRGDAIATVYSQRTSAQGHYYKLTRDDCAEIAHLIAAAPDLLAALLTTVDVIEQLIPEPSARGVADVVLSQARAAIRKARGQ